jgi:hypothetical protein
MYYYVYVGIIELGIFIDFDPFVKRGPPLHMLED